MRKRILLALLLISTIIYSQDSRKLPKIDANYQKYLNDGRKELYKNAFKIHIDGVLNNEFSALYERKLTSGISIEAGGGFITKYKAYFENDGMSVFDSTRYPQKPGYSFQIMPKIYFNKGGIDNGSYFGLMFKQRNSKNYFDKKVTYREFAFMAGAQYLVKKNICIDIGYGFGLASYRVAGVEDYNYYYDKWEPWVEYFGTYHLRLGIGFYFGANPYKTTQAKTKKIKKGEDNNEDED